MSLVTIQLDFTDIYTVTKHSVCYDATYDI